MIIFYIINQLETYDNFINFYNNNYNYFKSHGTGDMQLNFRVSYFTYLA